MARKSVEQLLRDLGGYKPGTPQYLLIEDEIRRRNTFWPEVRSWLAFVISIAALLVAILKEC